MGGAMAAMGGDMPMMEWDLPYGLGTPASSYALAATRHFAQYGTSSEQLAERLARLREEWPHPVAFVIGSDLGLDRAVLDAARFVLSFGPLTLTHELARVVLYEQLYRALTIEAGMSYHREPL